MPAVFSTIASAVSSFAANTNTPAEAVRVARCYTWHWIPSTSEPWRFHFLDKEALRQENPLLFILQGFSSVPLLGPVACPLDYLDIVAKTTAQPFVPAVLARDSIGTADTIRPLERIVFLDPPSPHQSNETPSFPSVHIHETVLGVVREARSQRDSLSPGAEVLPAVAERRTTR